MCCKGLSERVSPVLLCRLNGLSVALALEVQLAVVEPKELEDRDLPRLSELTFLVLLVAVLLQSAREKQSIISRFLEKISVGHNVL